MQIGLVGLTNSGKSTMFQLLTGASNSAGQNKANKGVVKVPDKRVDFLSGQFKPKKTTYATLEAVDIPGLIPGQEKSAVTFLQAVRDSDVLIHVIQAFDSDDAPHVEGSLDVFRDVEMVGYELLLADLDQVSKRLEKITSGKRKQENAVEHALLERIQKCLEDEKPILSLDMNEEEETLVRNFQFLTA
ncbi:MAG: GTPase, partial [Candidatus Saccharibacteria bacterium]